MKLNIYKTLPLGAITGLLLLGSLAAQAAAPVSPLGTWDCTVSGAQGRGLAFVTFNSDFTFSGYEILTTKAPVPVSSGSTTDARNAGGDVGRGTGSGTNSLPGSAVARTNLFGYADINGPWTYDLATGKVIGYFKQSVLDETGTNNILISIGFSGKVVTGQRLTMVASSPGGKVYFTGKPISPTFPDLTGTWYAFKKQNSASLVEFLSLSPEGRPGLYRVSGNGAGYTYDGYTIASGWKKLAFSLYTASEGSSVISLRSTVGPFYPRRMTAETSGIESPGGYCRFNASWYQVPTFGY